jgi:hypothetical protein
LPGYVKPALDGQGMVTALIGETVPGSKTPRFTPEKLKEALSSL